jgi:hypothetical protein
VEAKTVTGRLDLETQIRTFMLSGLQEIAKGATRCIRVVGCVDGEVVRRGGSSHVDEQNS